MLTTLDDDGNKIKITVVRGYEDRSTLDARSASDGHTREYQFHEIRASGGLPEIMAAIHHARHMGIEKYEYKGKLYTRRQARDFGTTNLTMDGSQLWIRKPSGHSFFMDAVECQRGQTTIDSNL